MRIGATVMVATAVWAVAHLATTALLTAQQVDRYKHVRGY